MLLVVTRLQLLKWSLRTSAGNAFSWNNMSLLMSCNSLRIYCCQCWRFLISSIETVGHFLIFGSMLVQAVRQLLTGITLLVARNCCWIADHF